LTDPGQAPCCCCCVQGVALRRLDACSGALLMGCSSGRLRDQGAYEPSGAIWSYLLAGELRVARPACHCPQG